MNVKFTLILHCAKVFFPWFRKNKNKTKYFKKYFFQTFMIKQFGLSRRAKLIEVIFVVTGWLSLPIPIKNRDVALLHLPSRWKPGCHCAPFAILLIYLFVMSAIQQFTKRQWLQNHNLECSKPLWAVARQGLAKTKNGNEARWSEIHCQIFIGRAPCPICPLPFAYFKINSARFPRYWSGVGFLPIDGAGSPDPPYSNSGLSRSSRCPLRLFGS